MAEDFGSLNALVNRLASTMSLKPLALVVGSGLTASVVPGVQGMIDLTEEYVAGEANADLEAALAAERENTKSLSELYGNYRKRVNQWLPSPAFDLIVQTAVLSAYPPAANFQRWRSLTPTEAGRVEQDTNGWTIPPGVAALAAILSRYPDSFGRRVFTTNFDPLLEIALRSEGTDVVSLSMKSDGSFNSVIRDDAIHVIHLHGYWRASDERDTATMLHDPEQLRRPRPNLQDDLAEFLQDKAICAVGYGGWNDIFMDTLRFVARRRELEMLWAVFPGNSEEAKRARTPIKRKLRRGATFYKGVDANIMFPHLEERLALREGGQSSAGQISPARVPPAEDAVVAGSAAPQPASRRPTDVLRRLEQVCSWRWDRGSLGSDSEPSLLYWIVRLRRVSVIHAVQAHVAAALSRAGVETLLCIDDLGIDRAEEKTAIFARYIERVFRRYEVSQPEYVSLAEYLSVAERTADAPLSVRPEVLPTSPWRVAQYYLAMADPSVNDVLRVAKIVDAQVDIERDESASVLIQALERRDGNKLLTPITAWSHFNSVVNEYGAADVMTLGGIDEAPMWQMWRNVFGRSVGHLYNPRIVNLHQDSGLIRWDNHQELAANISHIRELPTWDLPGHYIPWLAVNTIVLEAVLNGGREAPTIGGELASSWSTIRRVLADRSRVAIPDLALAVALFFEAT